MRARAAFGRRSSPESRRGIEPTCATRKSSLGLLEFGERVILVALATADGVEPEQGRLRGHGAKTSLSGVKRATSVRATFAARLRSGQLVVPSREGAGMKD